MTKKFCDECSNEIRFGCDPLSSQRNFGVSPSINSHAATKYAVSVVVHHHDTSNQPDLCGSCLNKVIREMVRP